MRAAVGGGLVLSLLWLQTGVASAQIPLQKGLTVVTASHWPDAGDYETIKQVTDVDVRAVTIVITGDTTLTRSTGLGALLGAAAGSGVVQRARSFRVKRIVLQEDLLNAREYRQIFEEDAPEVFAGTTALGISVSTLRTLKTQGRTELTIADYGSAGRASGGSAKAGGSLRLVTGGPSSLTVLLNGTPTALPVVHARGRLGASESEFVFLDDAANPLALRFVIGDNRLQVVRIEFPVSASAIEQQLASRKKADAYGIYFDFASDRIKPESETVLAEIGKVMASNPTWTLTVHGHTDNIGGPASNLDLSQRRAAAVKQALVSRYKVAPARLTTGGFGASRPIDTNDTLEGRARNRRVELTR
jgi:outer membrane protein OmpA-like peptidoglycan-associated protein